MKKIKKIVIANRGEIAIRIMRTANEMGVSTVAVYSDADKNSLFVKKADEAICIGGTHASESYLVQDKIIAAVKKTEADAIHPGYGFLSENASFARRCKEEGIIFIGPSHIAIEKLGSKIGAKEIMKKAGVPVVPGYNGEDQNFERFKDEAEKISYPVLLKANAGGGGKGMRIANNCSELKECFDAAKREAGKSFGDDTLLMEKYFPFAKHIEFQIFGDEHGNYTHFFERECSLQRRYQKVIEESPSPSLTDELRKKMGDAAVAAAAAVKYTNAGTVEFIYVPAQSSGESKGTFYFLEVNTRLQVEHPVTEKTTGLDLVRLQIEVAQGLPLKVNSENIKQYGHAIECRICAEDAENNFFPATGEILFLHEPALNGLRYDSGVQSGSNVDVFYDSMIAKVIANGKTRSETIQKMNYALSTMAVLGITTNNDFLKELLQHPDFVDGNFDTKLIERDFNSYKREVNDTIIDEISIVSMLQDWNGRREKEIFSASLNGWRNIFYQPQFYEIEIGDSGKNGAGRKVKVEYNNKGLQKFEVKIAESNYFVELNEAKKNKIICTINRHRKQFFIAKKNREIYVHHPESGTFYLKEIQRFSEPGNAVSTGDYLAPMPGEIVKVLVKAGDKIQSGKGMFVISSMKMETTIEAHSDGEVEEIFVNEKSVVDANSMLLKMKT